MMLDYTTIKAGDQVSVARWGSWNISNEGIYWVSQANKIKIVLCRVSDGYERTFSVKRRCEMNKESRYSSAFLESVASKTERDQQQYRERAQQQAWSNLEQASKQKNMVSVKAALAEIESLSA